MEGINQFIGCMGWLVVLLLVVIMLMLLWYFIGRHVSLSWGWK